MSDKFVLVVSDESDRKHGEISVLNTAHETERLVETLLDAGSTNDDKGVIFPSVQSRKVAINRDADTSAGAAMHRGRLRGLAPRQVRDAKL